MQASDVSQALDWRDPTPENVFSCLDTLSKYVMEHGASDKTALDAII
jgi:hypothetical protein